jgi:hypothetical protein
MSKKISQKTVKERKEEKLLKDKVKDLEKKVKELESLGRKPRKNPKIQIVKKFVLKNKLVLLGVFLLLVCLTSWEVFSLYAYRKGLYAATVAQSQGDFEKAEKHLEEVREVTHRSVVLFVARRDNVEEMISINNNWIENSKANTSASAIEEEQNNEIEEEAEENIEATEENENVYIPSRTPEPTTKPETETESTSELSEPPEEEDAPIDTRVDTTSPVLNDILLSRQTVTRGDSIRVTVDVTDDISGVSSVSVRLESPTGIHQSSYSIWSIDNQGRWYGDMVIPSNSEIGTWTVETVGVHDEAGNGKYYEYGVDIFKTFEVI